MSHQPNVFAPLPTVGRGLSFDLVFGADPRPALARLRDAFSIDTGVLGIGEPLALAVDRQIRGLRSFPPLAGRGCAFPAYQHALWAFFGGSHESEVHDRALSLRTVLGDDFVLRDEVATFKYKDGRDLSDYLDGSANPEGDDAKTAALCEDGSSFVAVQRWIHDLHAFKRKPENERDAIIGRRHGDNEEISDAPESAHVKRTAQENFDPPAFVVRRSMPWGTATEHGLYFVAYGESLDRFERILRRMAGLDDDVVDSLLSFTRAVSGAYYWCPPIAEAKLDLGAIL